MPARRRSWTRGKETSPSQPAAPVGQYWRRSTGTGCSGRTHTPAVQTYRTNSEVLYHYERGNRKRQTDMIQMLCSVNWWNLFSCTRSSQQRNPRGNKRALEDHYFDLESVQLICVQASQRGLTPAPERPKAPGAPWRRGCSASRCTRRRRSSCPGSGYRGERRQGHRRRWIWPCFPPGRKRRRADVDKIIKNEMKVEAACELQNINSNTGEKQPGCN